MTLEPEAPTTSGPLFDDLIHVPNRLRICAILASTASVEFATLRDRLQLSDSALSKHLSALEQAGYLQTTRTLRASRHRVHLALTTQGRQAYDGHVQALHGILATGA